MNNLEEILKKLKYTGGGYFRDGTVPQGITATVIHAPEILKEAVRLKEEIDAIRMEIPDGHILVASTSPGAVAQMHEMILKLMAENAQLKEQLQQMREM